MARLVHEADKIRDLIYAGRDAVEESYPTGIHRASCALLSFEYDDVDTVFGRIYARNPSDRDALECFRLYHKAQRKG